MPDLEQKKVSFECEKHGEVMVMLFKLYQDWSTPSCPECKLDEIAEQQQKEAVEKERKRVVVQTASLETRLKGSCIPPRFQGKDFTTYNPTTSSAQQNLGLCRNYAEKFSNVAAKGTSLILCGLPGTGKTHLACAIANHIITHHNKSAVYLHVVSAIRMVKDTYSKSSTRTEQEAINWFKIPDLLILDEVGIQFGTDTERTILFEIINARYEQLKPTILLSNLDIKGLVDYVGERAVDRMKENGGTILLFNWKSYR